MREMERRGGRGKEGARRRGRGGERRAVEGRQEKRRRGEGRTGEGKNDLTHPLSQIPGYATAGSAVNFASVVRGGAGRKLIWCILGVTIHFINVVNEHIGLSFHQS